MNFRNTIGTIATVVVQAFLSRSKTPEAIKAYVKSSLVYYGEIPFLYQVFELMTVRSTKERGNYKVVSPPFTVSSSKTRFSLCS
jgi:hypothetical protein